MRRFYDSLVNKTRVIIEPGEIYVAGDGEILSTVLGSCVSVCMYDTARRIGGLNHFMLAHNRGKFRQEPAGSGMYGETAIDELLTKMIHSGAHPSCIEAKIFGGASINFVKSKNRFHFAEETIIHTRTVLQRQQLPICAEDLGGEKARRLFFDLTTGKVGVQSFYYSGSRYPDSPWDAEERSTLHPEAAPSDYS